MGPTEVQCRIHRLSWLKRSIDRSSGASLQGASGLPNIASGMLDPTSHGFRNDCRGLNSCQYHGAMFLVKLWCQDDVGIFDAFVSLFSALPCLSCNQAYLRLRKANSEGTEAGGSIEAGNW